MDSAKLQAWRFHRQALDGRMRRESPAALLETCGWARSVGGAAPYLSLFARAGVRREAVDAALSSLELQELPAARGCTYVVPKIEFALALRVGQACGEGERKVALRLGVTDGEIDRLCQAVLDAVSDKPLSPDEIRAAVGAASRSLGEEGKKKGLSTTLPVALGTLQLQGEIRRVPVNGRLDQQRYGYVRWSPNPLSHSKPTPEESFSELARRYFAWIGPATAAEFQAFAGLSAKAAKEALQPLALEKLSGSDLLILREDLHKLEAFEPPADPLYALTSGLDALLLHRGTLKDLIAEQDLGRRIPGEKGPVELGAIAYLPSHAILDRGRLVGVWEYDAATESIAWLPFAPVTDELRHAVQRMEEYIRADLGDARSFSLDSPKSRIPRIEALRAAGAAAGRHA